MSRLSVLRIFLLTASLPQGKKKSDTASSKASTPVKDAQNNDSESQDESPKPKEVAKEIVKTPKAKDAAKMNVEMEQPADEEEEEEKPKASKAAKKQKVDSSVCRSVSVISWLYPDRSCAEGKNNEVRQRGSSRRGEAETRSQCLHDLHSSPSCGRAVSLCSFLFSSSCCEIVLSGLSRQR